MTPTRAPRKKAKPRKPAPFRFSRASLDAFARIRQTSIRTWNDEVFTPKNARRFAVWLLRAADWLEAQDGK